MAEYYFEMDFVSRGSGGKAQSKNTIAKAAYDSREKLTDERTGITYDYTRKGEAEWSGIFVPEDGPEWMQKRNRQEIWNKLEAREDTNTRHATAQPSRTWKLAIPCELTTKEQRERLAIDYGRSLMRAGWLVDMSIHPPEGASPNYHIHAQLVMREITPDGFGKRIRLADKDQKITRQDEMQSQKQRWVNIAAHHMERYGHKLEADRFRASYLKLEKQREDALKRGDHQWAKHTDREPTIHMGPTAWNMEKQGIRTRKGDLNREIKERNEARQKDNVRDQKREEWAHRIEELEKLRGEKEGSPTKVSPTKPPYWLRGDARQVWITFNITKDAGDFKKEIEFHGMHLSRVTKDDAQASRTENWMADRFDTYRPILRTGEYVVLNEKGHAFRLHELSVGQSFGKVKAFMAPLDKTPVDGYRKVWNELHEKRQREIDTRPNGRDATSLPRGVTRRASRSVGSILNIGVKVAEALSPVITPEQRKLDAEIANQERREQDERAARRRGDDRER